MAEITDIAFPFPSDSIRDAWHPVFTPADGLMEWVRAALLDPASKIYNRDHDHLQFAEIGFLWTNAENVKRGKRIVGDASMGLPTGSGWTKALKEYQLRQWFGSFGDLPDFVIRLDALYFASASDGERLALIEHELYHCGQQHDEFGSPKFRRDGKPAWMIRPHDVEQFVGVVRRYGADAAHVREMVEVAERGATIADVDIKGLCGNCA